MSMEQNQLTRDLYAAGYTREDHPSFVYWSDWQNFGYLFEALLKFTWETPCGLLVDGKSDLGRGLACCDASFQGIDYCPENDNPLLRCPYERKDCPHSISGFPVPLCPCHTTGKRYSFEQSVEKVETERSERQHRQYMEITGGVYCACVVGCNGYEGGRVEVKYDVEQCIHKICIGNFLYLVATIAFHYISCASIIIHTYNNANMVSYGPAVLRVNDNNVTDLESIGTAC